MAPAGCSLNGFLPFLGAFLYFWVCCFFFLFKVFLGHWLPCSMPGCLAEIFGQGFALCHCLLFPGSYVVAVLWVSHSSVCGDRVQIVRCFGVWPLCLVGFVFVSSALVLLG